MNWRSIDEPTVQWRSIDEAPPLPPPAAKASSFVAELVILVALAAGVTAYINLRPGQAEASPRSGEAKAGPSDAAAKPEAVVEVPAAKPDPGPGEAKAAPPEPPASAPAGKAAATAGPDPKPLVAVAVPLPVTLKIPALPARSAEAEAYYREWRSAAARAAQRDLDGAAVLIKKAGRAGDEARRESSVDLADLDRLRSFETRACAKLAALAKGARVELEPRGAAAISGEVLAAGLERLEIKRGEDSLFVETSDLSWATLAKLGDEDARALGLAWLLEGCRDEAWEAAGRRVDSFDAKHWHLSKPEAPAELDVQEREARRLLYEAERAYRAPATRASAVGKYRILLAEFPETSLTRRSLARIQGRAKAPEEVYFGAADLRGSGTFQLGKDGWTTVGQIDLHKARFSFVEAEFEAEPGTSYRLFVRVGGCCAETLRIYGQASGLEKAHPGRGVKVAVEPGSIYGVTLRRPEVDFPKTHAPGHKKLWGWTELPLPAYPAGGTKRVRILTEREGVAVSGLLVTTSRQGAPTDGELPALEATRRVE
jgi:hypothetical protein